MTSATLYSSVTSYMDEAKRYYQGDAAGGVVMTEIPGDEGSWRVYIQITDDDTARRVVIHAQLPVRIPGLNRGRVIELIGRINYDLIVGNFEFDMDSGEVLFQTTLDLADGQLTQAMFERMYALNGQITNRYLAQILSVGYGKGKPPKAALESRRHDMLLQ